MKRINILIVEDDPYSSKRLIRHIDQLGHLVSGVAVSVNEGIAAFHKEVPDLVIMDIELEDNDEGGILLAKTFNEKKHVPIIFYSGNLSNKKLRKQAAKTSTVAILSKTFDIHELEANIDKAMFEINNQTQQSTNDNQLLISLISETNELISKAISLLSNPIGILNKRNDSFWITPKMGLPRKINIDKICWIQPHEKNVIRIYTETEIIEYGITLSAFEKKVNNDSLIRVHHSCIINKHKAIGLLPTEKVISILRGRKVEEVHYSDTFIKAFKQDQNFIFTRR